MKHYKYKVATQCMTYNHKPYIEDTLNGFVIQQTSFPVVYIVVDDASNDGESDLLRNWANNNLVFDDEHQSYKKKMHYGELIYAKYKNNPNAIFAIFLLAENHYQTGKESLKLEYIAEWTEQSEYYAICEGDDYWTDPLKLSKQVDVMEHNPDAAMVHTRFCFLYENFKRIENDDFVCQRNKQIITEKGDSIAFDILEDNHYRIQTMTVLYRKSNYMKINQYLCEEKGLFMMGDTQLWLNLLSTGKIVYLPESTAVYRINVNSASKSEDKIRHYRFELSCEEMRFYYAKKYNIKPSHFFWRYLKVFVKYKLYHPDYTTNPKILSNDRYATLVNLVKMPFCVYSYLKK